MKQGQEKIYRELWAKFSFDENLQDSLQFAMVKILENKPTFNDDSHFRNYLLSAVKTGRIDIEQQKENLVSLSNLDKETDLESYQV